MLFMARNVHIFLGGGNWSIVSVEHPLPRQQVRPFLAKSLHELPQGTDDVVHIPCTPLDM
jgi:hypothetical protein